MTEQIRIWLDDLTGITGMYLWLRDAAGAIVNTDGDLLTEIEGGLFAATVDESRAGLGVLRAIVSVSTTAQNVIDAQWLIESNQLCSRDSFTGVGYTRAVESIAFGTVGEDSTTTSIVSSECSPPGSVADQFKHKVLTFARDTVTAELRSVSCVIYASTDDSAPTFQTSLLPVAPSAGDTFSIA